MPRRKTVPTPTDRHVVDPVDALIAPLNDFEGKRVIGAGIEIPNVAGGLRDAMRFAPAEIHLDDEGFMLVKWHTKSIKFVPSKDDPDCLVRVAVLEADGAVLAGEVDVAQLFKDQQERIKTAKEKAEGITRLPLDGGGELSDEDWEGQ